MTECHRPADHRHGTTDAHADGCRCPDTLRAHDIRLAKMRRRKRQESLGLRAPNPKVPIAPVNAHLRKLRRAGHRTTGIAAATGVPTRALRAMRRKGRKTVYKNTADAILAYKGGLAATVFADNVPALPTARRLRALAAIGHSVEAVVELSPIPAGKDPAKFRTSRASLLKQIRAGKVAGTRETIDREVEAAYERLWNRDPARAVRFQRSAVTRTLNTAARHGWQPPMDMDDDRLSDPTYPVNLHATAQELIAQ